jgi:hypothetical protein
LNRRREDREEEKREYCLYSFSLFLLRVLPGALWAVFAVQIPRHYRKR